jgi:hypothetical protein
MRRPALALAALLLAGAAQAEKACFLSYAGFEEKYPQHLDLDLCPGGQVKPEEGFCRVALIGADVVVYEFRHGEPEPCLVRADRYAVTDFIARFGATYTKP